MSEQRWIRWKPVSQFAKDYDIDHINFNIKGLRIVLYEMGQEYKTVEILFKNPVIAYTRTNESFLLNLEGTFEDDSDSTENPHRTFYKISNSSYIKRIEQERQNSIDSLQLMHFALLTFDDMVDIVADYEPEITIINWNIPTLMLLYKERIIPIIDRFFPAVKVILYGSRSQGKIITEKHGGVDTIKIALDAGYTIDPKMIEKLKDTLRREAAVQIPKNIVDFHAVSEELRQQIVKEGIDWAKEKNI